jgi:hypothetical protein
MRTHGASTVRNGLRSDGLATGGFDPADYTDGEGNELSPIFGSEESDTPEHCSSCGVFLENALTPDGYAYVVDTLAQGTGRVDVMREWWDYYSGEFDPEDWQAIAEGWVRYALPDGVDAIWNGDHTAVLHFTRPTDRDDFTRGRGFGPLRWGTRGRVLSSVETEQMEGGEDEEV